MTISKNDGFSKVRQAIHEHLASLEVPAFDSKRPKVRLHEPTFGAEEICAFTEHLIETRVTMGAAVRGFEEAFRAYGRFGEAVSVNSGSSANLLAIAALVNPLSPHRLAPGDEVIVSALSWSTTVWPLVQFGLVPVIVDIDPDTLNIDPEQARKSISAKTRAIMPVHVYGNPCDMSALSALCADHDLILIEDCCEAIGAEFDGRAVGRFGAVGTFSFYFSHHATTLEGGMCVTEDFDFSELMRILRAHGWIRDCKNTERLAAKHPDIDPKFLFVNSGFNFRITEPQGAMGRIQVAKLNGFVDIRRKNAAYWRQALAPYRDRLRMQDETPGGRHSWFGIPVTVTTAAPFTASDLRRHLENNGIETRSIIAGNIARHPGMGLYPHRIEGDLGHSDLVMRNGFSFGNHQAIGPEALAHIHRAFDEFLRQY